MDRTPHATGRGRYGVIAAVAVVVAALVVGGAALKVAGGGHDARPSASAQLSASSQLPDGTLDLDLGPVTDPAAIAACLAPDFASDPAEVSVVYGQVQKTRDGSVPVLVLRNTAGEIRLCDVFGGDYPSKAPRDEASAAAPVAFYASGRRDWNCEESTRTLRHFTMTEWLSVAGRVQTVRTRFVVAGTPGPWFTTKAVDGLAHLQAWLDGPLAPGTRVMVQHQVLDADGHRVPQKALPGHQRLPGCSAGGSAQIG